MKIQLPPTVFFSFLSTAVLLAPTTSGKPFRPTSGDTDFIRTSCDTTLYPETCFKTLSGYSDAIQHNSGSLARVAIRVALSNVTRMASYVYNISRSYSGDNPKVFGVIHDCSSVFGDAVDQIHRSLLQMKHLVGTGELLRFQLSNVQTWMSAALTNEDTCTDGFYDVADGGVKSDVCGRVGKVKEVTSNALALVNSFADKITS